MRNIYKSKLIYSALALILSFSFTLNSCKEEEKLFVGLNSPEKTLLLGESYQFNYTLTSVGGASTDGITAEWSVADPSIISVDQTGLVTAQDVGNTILTAKLSNGNYVTSSITVEKPNTMLFSNSDQVYIQTQGLRDTIRLSLNVNELDLEKGINVYSLDENIASIDTVTPMDAEDFYFLLRPGNEGDTRVYLANGNLKTYCDVHVGPVVDVAWDLAGTVTATSMRVFKGEPFELVLYTSVYPSNDWQREDLYEWRVENNDENNPAAEFVDFNQSVRGQISWTVNPKNLGTSKFYVTSRGKEVSLVLKVVDKDQIAVNSISLECNGAVVGYADPDSTYIGVVKASSQEPLAVRAINNPQNSASTWPFTWVSSNPDVAVYDEVSGMLNVLGDGETEISVTSKDLTAKCKFIISTPVTSIEVTSVRKKIMVGDKEQMSYITVPEGAKPAVTWSTDNGSILSIDANGLVAGVGVGTANVYAETESGVKSAAYSIEVVEPLSDYSYEGAAYIYSFAAGNLTIEAQAPDDSDSSILNASLNVSALNNGTYTVGQNMSDVTFSFNGISANITSGTIVVSGDSVKEFDIDLVINLGTNSINLKGKLLSDNCLN